MKPSDRRTTKLGHSRHLHAVVFAVAMLSFALNSANAWGAGLAPSDYRVSYAGDKFEDTWQAAFVFKKRPPRRLRAKRLEVAIGSITNSADSSAFVSIGPVWRLPIEHRRMFVEFGLSPTLIIGDSTFGGRDLGGNFHFTSSLSIGAAFGRFDALSVSLRAQHISNGGLNSTNPGIDMIGINVAFDFTDR